MLKKILSVFICISLISPSLSMGKDDPTEGKIYLKSNNAKLYQALKLIDDRENWLDVSELLREVLASDISNKFIRNQLSLAKDEIDAEVYKSRLRMRVMDWPFVVAKLRIIEAMMANHSRLNVSYDREVALIKGLLQTYFFPGMEDEGEIIFPPKRDYSFDLYGYVKKNILETETAPSGVVDDPRFPYVAPVKKKTPSKTKKAGPIRPKKIKRLVPINEDGEDDYGDRDKDGKPTGISDDLETIGDIGDSISKTWGATKRELKDLVRAVRLQNQYEPWAMLMQIIANPDAIYSDPQLFDFMKGIKLRVKVSESYDFEPVQQQILEEVLTDQTDTGLTIEQELDSETGKVVMYAVSNMVDPEIISFRYLIYLKKVLEFSAHPTTQAQGLKFAKSLENVGKILQTIKGTEVWYSKLLSALGRGTGHVIVGGKKIVTSVMEKDGQVLKLLRKLSDIRIWKTNVRIGTPVEWIAKNDRYFKAVLFIAMAHDLAAGMVQYLSAVDKFAKTEVLQETLAKEVVHMLYLAPLVTQRAIWAWLSWGAFAFDVGNLLSDRIPPAHGVVKTVFAEWLPYHINSWVIGTTYRGAMINDYENRLDISVQEMPSAIYTFQQAIDASETEGQMIISKEAFEQEMKHYANKRLFLIYYLIQRWNNNEVREFGEMESGYLKDYEKYKDVVEGTLQMYQQKKQVIIVGSVEDDLSDEDGAKADDRYRLKELPEDE